MEAKNKKDDPSSTIILMLVVIALLLINLFVVGFVRTSGSSMSPTIPNGTWLFIQKAGFTPKRDDIFTAYADGMCVVKRVVGLPGETINITEDGTILIDGEKYHNRFQEAYVPNAEYVGSDVTLGDDEYFLMGDNRYDSRDSRMYGPVTRSKIFGKVIHAFTSESAIEARLSHSRDFNHELDS